MCGTCYTRRYSIYGTHGTTAYGNTSYRPYGPWVTRLYGCTRVRYCVGTVVGCASLWVPTTAVREPRDGKSASAASAVELRCRWLYLYIYGFILGTHARSHPRVIPKYKHCAT